MKTCTPGAVSALRHLLCDVVHTYYKRKKTPKKTTKNMHCWKVFFLFNFHGFFQDFGVQEGTFLYKTISWLCMKDKINKHPQISLVHDTVCVTRRGDNPAEVWNLIFHVKSRDAWQVKEMNNSADLIKGDFLCFSIFFPFPSVFYIIVRVQSPKLLHQQKLLLSHCCWNASSAVPPLIPCVCDLLTSP